MGASRLRRAAVRIPEELLGEIGGVAQRLQEETGLEHSAAAVVRGLLALGLAALAGREHLAPAFVGVRVARGKKRGGQ
jgi:hypothetical protein